MNGPSVGLGCGWPPSFMRICSELENLSMREERPAADMRVIPPVKENALCSLSPRLTWHELTQRSITSVERCGNRWAGERGGKRELCYWLHAWIPPCPLTLVCWMHKCLGEISLSLGVETYSNGVKGRSGIVRHCGKTFYLLFMYRFYVILYRKYVF